MRTYGRLMLARDQSSWRLDADPHVHMRAKRIFGKLASSALHLDLSNTPETCRELAWFMDLYPLDMTDADRAVLLARAAAHVQNIARLRDLIDPNYIPPPVDLALPLRTYQERSVRLYLGSGSLLCGDDVGLGKTAVGIGSFTDPRTLPAIVVTLAHLPKQWEAQIRKFAPDLSVHRIKKGTPYALPTFMGKGPDVLIINYHKLVGWAKVLGAYGKSLVFDEIQELRHDGTARYEAAEHLCEAIAFKLGLSATPIYNYGGEIFNIFNLLKPGCLGTRREFSLEWCHYAGLGEKARLTDPRAFGTWARDNFLMIRHTRQDAGREIPPVLTVPYRIDADTEALDAIKGDAAELARLILSTAAAPTDRWRAAGQLDVLVRQATGIAKAPFAAAFVRMLLEQTDDNEKIVLYGWHREVYDIWLQELREFNPRLYTGSETATQKDAAKEAFVSGDCRVLIISLRAGAGLDGLQAASSCVVFGELDWSPGVHEQCIGRVARDGQEKNVAAYYLISDSGSDPAMVEVLGLKKEQAEGIRNPQADGLERLEVDVNRVKTLAESYLRQNARKRGMTVITTDAEEVSV